MESKDQTPSVILKLMGLDKVPPQHKDPVRDRQKVLSEDYLQKVASIGVRKKRSSHRHHSFGKEESDDVLKVIKTIRRDKNHNPSKGNGKENPSLSVKNVEDVPPQLLNGSVKCKPETSVDTTSSFSLETNVKAERGYPLLQQKTNNGLQIVVHGEAGLYEVFRLSRSQLVLKDETSNSRLAFSNGTRNLSRQTGFSNDKIKRNIRCKVGVNYSFARKVSMARPLCAASVIGDNCTTMTKDDLFQKYWGLRKNASANWSIQKSKKQNINNQKGYSEEMKLRSSSEKSPSFSSYFNGNDTEENCIDLHKMKKRCYGMDLSDMKPMLSQLSSSGPSPAFIDSQILQQTCLLNDDVKNNKHEDHNMSKQSAVSPDSSVDCLVSDAKTEIVGWSHNIPTKQQSESTASVMTDRDSDSLSHTSYALTQQDPSEFQEDSAYSLCSGADPDSLGSFQEAYEPSPISVLYPTFREDISFISECGAGAYDSSEVDDEGLDLNVSSDEDVGKESVSDFEEKKDIVGISRTEESRDFSYVVEVITEAGISNRSLFKDFTTWHSAECPISPSVFEILEKKFGEQQHWKRSERRLLFDRINLGLLEILQPYLYVPNWEMPVSRRVNVEPSQDMIEEEIWGLLVSQEKKASKESSDDMLGGEIRWIELGEDVEDIVREIVTLLIEELANEIVSLENF